jgi:histidyl-tRNA synthetase
MSNIQAIRGMHDISPAQIRPWQFVESKIRALAASYSIDEIRSPILESTDLFARTLGQATDIVEKEMYTFTDRNGDSLTLRPEGTAGTVRACIQEGLLHNQLQRLWYMGPMYRHERPQKGRTRQFHQFGVETFGMAGPDADAEIILIAADLFKQLGILSGLRLEINSLGLSQERAAYRDALVVYFKQFADQLDEDSQRRLESNPLRILDSKNPAMKSLIETAPVLRDYLSEASKAHFASLCDLLDMAGIAYTVNDRLVRGLDYYTHTVFEWITDSLGAQGTVCGGGRYDGLVEMLGGKPTPAVGFALGMERLIELVTLALPEASVVPMPHLCILPLSDQALGMSLSVAQTLRRDLPGLRVQTLLGGGSVKSLFKRADKSGADFAVIIGEEEIQRKTVTLKPLRDTMEQSQWHLDNELLRFLAQQFDLTLTLQTK